MIHEPAKWAGWQSTTAAQHHLDRLRQMQDQIYRILAKRSGRPLKQIIRDTRRNDFYLDARKALVYGLIDAIVESAADAETDLVARSEPLRHGQRPQEPNTARVAAAGETRPARQPAPPTSVPPTAVLPRRGGSRTAPATVHPAGTPFAARVTFIRLTRPVSPCILCIRVCASCIVHRAFASCIVHCALMIPSFKSPTPSARRRTRSRHPR